MGDRELQKKSIKGLRDRRFHIFFQTKENSSHVLQQNETLTYSVCHFDGFG